MPRTERFSASRAVLLGVLLCPEPAVTVGTQHHAQAYLQHVGEVLRDALQHSTVRPPSRGLPGRHVEVALAHQGPHFFQDSARVNVVTQGFMHCHLLVVEAGQGENRMSLRDWPHSPRARAFSTSRCSTF